jgi:hypothetical protein
MGLDMYAYTATQSRDSVDEGTPAHREIAYWRKHPNLHGWMEQLWFRKNGFPTNTDDQFIEDLQPPSFNGIELELTWDDLEQLERDIENKQLPATSGFFFGDNSDDHYQEHDLAFVRKAKAELFLGLKVFYNSSW